MKIDKETAEYIRKRLLKSIYIPGGAWPDCPSEYGFIEIPLKNIDKVLGIKPEFDCFCYEEGSFDESK